MGNPFGYRRALEEARKMAHYGKYQVALLYDPLRGYYALSSGIVLKEERKYLVEIIGEDKDKRISELSEQSK